MLQIVAVAVLWVSCSAEYVYHLPYNSTRSTVSGIAAYRSALTLDWLAGEDSRQRELVRAFETEETPKPRSRNTDCIAYHRPASGKVARLLLELLKNLEGDDAMIIPELTQTLIRSKLLVETSMLEAEPDLESLVQTPGVMMGEPHSTFPRILAMVWMVASDPITTKKSGWCPIRKLNRYLTLSRPVDIANQMRAVDPIIARARFVMEEFIQNVTPLNIYPDATPNQQRMSKPRRRYNIKPLATQSPRASAVMGSPSRSTVKRAPPLYELKEKIEATPPDLTQPLRSMTKPVLNAQSATVFESYLILSVFLILVL